MRRPAIEEVALSLCEKSILDCARQAMDSLLQKFLEDATRDAASHLPIYHTLPPTSRVIQWVWDIREQVDGILRAVQNVSHLQACDNIILTHPGQTITDKNIGEVLSTTYFKAATVGNAVKGFKKCGIELHNPLVLSEYDFAAAKTTDDGVVGDAAENNSANPQTLVVENQHINPTEAPEVMVNADSDASKKPVSIFFHFKSLPKASVSQTVGRPLGAR
ncbi:dynein beta chain, ciliary [Trichonephila clavipes]|nr:dynein beta chain, ciliary [Trichonephila clavipes]